MHYSVQKVQTIFLSVFRCFWPKTKLHMCKRGQAASTPDTKQENSFKATHTNMCIVQRSKWMRGDTEGANVAFVVAIAAAIFFSSAKCWTIFKLFLMDFFPSLLMSFSYLKPNACHIRASAQRLGLLIFLSHLMWLMFRRQIFFFKWLLHASYSACSTVRARFTSGAVEFHTPFFCYLLSIIIIVDVAAVVVTISGIGTAIIFYV